MKGQAFIALPNSARAEKALAETNGFMLQGKPMVIQFARSAQSKEVSTWISHAFWNNFILIQNKNWWIFEMESTITGYVMT